MNQSNGYMGGLTTFSVKNYFKIKSFLKSSGKNGIHSRSMKRWVWKALIFSCLAVFKQEGIIPSPLCASLRAALMSLDPGACERPPGRPLVEGGSFRLALPSSKTSNRGPYFFSPYLSPVSFLGTNGCRKKIVALDNSGFFYCDCFVQ